ncbi:hypothetical protein [Manganibacter manganicus]|uniref:PepSY domain-containing protein n=1 Tax=Manganibacter manganicus TaxID=1873176 RepID=A0A1V8RNS9_9HYPH|nr:hypothetical protein [Pseudaminobacter manganicus]OQM74850.1 hypothetical protein BFN67_04270 [Pseudaminobacter manganicus]
MRAIVTSTIFAFATMLAMPAGVATAQDIELHLGNDGPTVRLRDDCDPRREYCRDRDDRRAWRHKCTPERALDKASRMGIRRARIDHIGHRSIEVRGRSHGERVSVRFDRRSSRCRVLG